MLGCFGHDDRASPTGAETPGMIKIVILTLLLLLFQPATAQPEAEWAIVIHGGAGAKAESMSAEELTGLEQALLECLKEGAELLENGSSALDCVEAVVRLLEDDPHFNAGRGAVFNARGEHELDASIMDGTTLSGGAVAGVRTVKNPISLARGVMENTPHVLLVSEGAEEFAGQEGVERVPNSYFSTPERRAQWEKRNQYSKGTVGCVVRDKQGRLAAATSTGGLTNKKWGRIGDSPILGAGCYADNQTSAVSCTGTGEEFIRRAVAYDVGARMKYSGQSLEQAAKQALDNLPPDCGGLIAVDASGQVVAIFNTPGMSRGWAVKGGDFYIGVGPETRRIIGRGAGGLSDAE